MSEKKIGCIRIEYEDGTVEFLEPMNMKHLKFETKLEMSLVFSKIHDELDQARERARKRQDGSGGDLGVDVNDGIETEDKFGG